MTGMGRELDILGLRDDPRGSNVDYMLRKAYVTAAAHALPNLVRHLEKELTADVPHREQHGHGFTTASVGRRDQMFGKAKRRARMWAHDVKKIQNKGKGAGPKLKEPKRWMTLADRVITYVLNASSNFV